MEFLADFGGFNPPPFFCPKIGFWFRWGKIFVANFDHSLDLTYPENLSQIRVGWVFGWFWEDFPPFLPKIGFWLRLGKKNCHQLWSFIGFSLPWKFEPNPSWLSFGLIFGGFTPLFCPKIGFWLRGVKILPPTSTMCWSLNILKVWFDSVQ